MNKYEKYYLIQTKLLDPYSEGDQPKIFLISPSDLIIGGELRTSWLSDILQFKKDVWLIPDIIEGGNLYIEFTDEVDDIIWESSIEVYDIEKYKVTEISKESYFSYKLILDSYKFLLGQLP